MQTTIPYKRCRCCGKTIRGRSDKKFCDDHCRNQYNNQVRDDSGRVRAIQYFLRKNRRILEELLPPAVNETTVARECLLQQGFSLRYHTHCSNGQRQYCYDYWYRILDEEQVLIGREDS